jgi:peroxiredoxin
VAHNQALAEERRLTFEVLFDEGNRVAAAFGLTFPFPDYLIQTYQEMGTLLPAYNGDESWVLPIPARFIVDTDGLIYWSEANTDYTIRPEPAQTVALVQQLVETKK